MEAELRAEQAALERAKLESSLAERARHDDRAEQQLEQAAKLKLAAETVALKAAREREQAADKARRAAERRLAAEVKARAQADAREEAEAQAEQSAASLAAVQDRLNTLESKTAPGPKPMRPAAPRVRSKQSIVAAAIVGAFALGLLMPVRYDRVAPVQEWFVTNTCSF